MASEILTANFNDYELGWNYRKSGFQRYKTTLFYAALVFLLAGLAALYAGFIVLAVALLAVGAFFNQGSSHYALIEDVMTEHYYLARFFDEQVSDLAAVRSQLQQERHSPDFNEP